MIIVTPKPGSCLKTFDALAEPSLAQCQALVADKFEAAMTYTNVVTAAGLAAKLDAGLSVFFATEGLSSTTQPTAQLGADMAGAAVQKLAALGVPLGTTIFSDLEWAGAGAPWAPDAWIAYANAHAAELVGGGHIGGAYFGGGIGLTSAEMTSLACTRYGKGAARVIDRNRAFAEPGPGWCWVQGAPTDVLHSSGARIDLGVLWSDYRLRTVSLVVSG